MPDQITDPQPVGQPYGKKTQQQEFVQQTGGLAAPIEPNIAPEVFEQVELPPDEPEVPNTVGLATGDIDLNQILFANSQRPDEEVTVGLPGSPVPQKVSDLLDGLVSRGFASQDVVSLARLARDLDL